MHTGLIKIPARSHRQAMDWSLVLASQGIETFIGHAENGRDWDLLVSTDDHERARQAIKLYRIENQKWPWQRKVFAEFAFDWGSVAWALLLILFFWLDSRTDLRATGMMIRHMVDHGAWWQFFTATWLHSDLAHLAANATIGLVLLGLTMGCYGTGAGLLAAYLAGAGGYLLDWLVQAHSGLASARFIAGSLGASSMVMGCLGLLAVQSVALLRKSPYAARYIVAGLSGAAMLFVLLGLSPGTDVVAHLGGFFSGLILGPLLVRFGSVKNRPLFNLASGIIFVLLVIIPWWLALHASSS